jgi:hypothetical protein
MSRRKEDCSIYCPRFFNCYSKAPTSTEKALTIDLRRDGFRNTKPHISITLAQAVTLPTFVGIHVRISATTSIILEGLRKSFKNSVGVPVKIRTEHLSNTSLESYL